MGKHQAVIENGVVTNIIVGDGGGVDLPENSPVAIGWSYDGVAFTEPPQMPADVRTAALVAIAALESKQGRALREAALGMAGAVNRLKTLDTQIAALRAKLV